MDSKILDAIVNLSKRVENGYENMTTEELALALIALKIDQWLVTMMYEPEE